MSAAAWLLELAKICAEMDKEGAPEVYRTEEMVEHLMSKGRLREEAATRIAEEIDTVITTIEKENIKP